MNADNTTEPEYCPRRKYLQTIGTLGLLGAAGCLGDDNDTSDDDADDSDDTIDDDTDDDAPNPAHFTFDSLSPGDTELEQGDPFAVSATVTNVGEQTGLQEITFSIDGTQVDRETLTLEAGAEGEVDFTISGLQSYSFEPGDHRYQLAADIDKITAMLTVSEGALPDSDAVYPYATLPADPTSQSTIYWIDQRDGATGEDQVLEYATISTEAAEVTVSGIEIPHADPSAYLYYTRLTNLPKGMTFAGWIDDEVLVRWDTFPDELPAEGMNFVVFSDLHIDRSQAMDDPALMAPVNDESPQFILFAGDYLTFPTSDYDDEGIHLWLRVLDEYYGMIQDRKLCPSLPVPGNHDIDGNHQWDGVGDTDPEMNYFQFFFRDPAELDPPGQNYGVVQLGDYLQLLAIDSHSAEPSAVGAHMASEADEGYHATIPFHHSPLLEGGSRGSNDDALQREMRNAFAELYEALGVKANFCGHIHLHKRTVPWKLVDEEPSADYFEVNDKYLIENTDDPSIVEFGDGYREGRTPNPQWYLDHTESQNQFYSVSITEDVLTVLELDEDGELWGGGHHEFPL